MKFEQPIRKCPKCGFEIPGNDGTAGREWKPGKGRLACENCARAVKAPKGYALRGEQRTIDAQQIKID